MAMIVFGAGDYGFEFVRTQLLACAGKKIVAFVDNNSDLHGKSYYGIPVLSPKMLDNYSFDKIVISPVSLDAINSISSQLAAMGIPDDKIWILHPPRNPYSLNNIRVKIVAEYAHYVYRNNIQGNVAECGVQLARFIHE